MLLGSWRVFVHWQDASWALGSVPGDQAPGLILGGGRAPAPGQQGHLGKPIPKGKEVVPVGLLSRESLGNGRSPEAELLRLASQSSGRLSQLSHGLPLKRRHDR